MRVYLAPIIIIALLIAAVIFFVSCSTGFGGSIGCAEMPHAAGSCKQLAKIA